MNFEPSPRSLNFVKALEFTLPWEAGRERDGSLKKDGGLHYKDDGMATKWGIHQKANPDIDVASLTLDQAIEIYKDRYWLWYLHRKPVYVLLDSAEIGLAVSVFDAGVNCGQPRAWKWFLRATDEKLKNKDPSKIVNDLRGAYYFDLKTSNPEKHGPKYNGWMRRLADLRKYVEILRKDAS